MENRARKPEVAVISFVGLRERVHGGSPRIYTRPATAALGRACSIQTGNRTADASLQELRPMET
jgi:hypothetical protein